MKELDIAVEAARKAGDIVRCYYAEGNYQTSYKLDGNRGHAKASPVTDADIASDGKIKEILLGAFPAYGWLSEETRQSPERFGKHRVWVVDSLDGTREFTQGIPEFAISIGLVEGRSPIVGVVYNPTTDELFWAIAEKGAFYNNRHMDRPLQCSQQNQLSQAKLIVSRSEYAKGLLEPFRRHVGDIIPSGSCAYKLVRVARGDADLYLGKHDLHEWDTCGGEVILREAGGTFGSDRRYNRRYVQVSTGIIAGNPTLVRQMRGLLHYTPGSPIYQ